MVDDFSISFYVEWHFMQEYKIYELEKFQELLRSRFISFQIKIKQSRLQSIPHRQPRHAQLFERATYVVSNSAAQIIRYLLQ